jgi:hypothetical protein
VRNTTRIEYNLLEKLGETQDVVFLSDLNISPDIIGFEYLQRGYENIWMKYVEMLKSWTDFNYDWHFFTDDYTFVNIENMSTNRISKTYYNR